MTIPIIIAHEKGDTLSIDYFTEQLKKKWPDVKVNLILEDTHLMLRFETLDYPWILGRFSGTGVSYEGYGEVEDAQFALWYRTVLPCEWKLRIYDSSMSFDYIFLTQEMTQEEIISGFHTPFDISKYE